MPGAIDHLPAAPVPEIDPWAAQLTEMAKKPLEFCPRLPQIAKRLEAFWDHGSLGRPVLLGHVGKSNRHIELFDEPEKWVETKVAEMREGNWLWDSIPYIRVDFGPVMLGGLFGATTEYTAGTMWTHAFINDEWSNVPDWKIQEQGKWWKLLRTLTDLTAQAAAGRFVVCGPDWGGSADVMLNLRGATELCMDAIDRPEVVRRNIDAIYDSWRQAWSEFYRISMNRGAAVCWWLRLWSSRPYAVPACDFNFMLGPDQFAATCLPDIARQVATAGRAIFHLDGPGASKHVDALLDVPGLNIQFTPGVQTADLMEYQWLYKKVQARGRSLLMFVPAGQVMNMCRTLSPDGLAIIVETQNAEQAAAVQKQVFDYYGVKE